MLDHAMRDHDEVRERLGADGATLWVNVSARQLDDPAFASRVLARAATLSHPGLLGLEIPDRVLAATPRSADVLAPIEIEREPCRERDGQYVCLSVVAVSMNKQ